MRFHHSKLLWLAILALVVPAVGQTPQQHYLRFNGESMGQVTDYGRRTTAPALHGTAEIVDEGDPSRGPFLRCNGLAGDMCALNAPLDLTGSWTIEIMARDERPSSDDTQAHLLGTTDNIGSVSIVRGGFAGTGRIAISAPSVFLSLPGAVQQNQWVHVAVVYDAGADLATAYLNGVAVDTDAASNADVSLPSGLTVGSRGVSFPYDGDLDELRIWTEARTPAQIAASATAQLTIVEQLPWIEDFESHLPGGVTASTLAPPGWHQVEDDATGPSSDWFFRVGPTPSINVGPGGDRTDIAGRYAHAEDSLNDETVVLRMPLIDLVEATNPILRFWCHSHDATGGGATNSLQLQLGVLSPSGEVFVNLGPTITELGPDWTLLEYDLAVYAGDVIRLQLAADMDNGGRFEHDIAIDDVSIVEGSGIAEEPKFGFATLDINDATELGGLPVSHGAPGPYYTSIDLGLPSPDAVSMTITGRPQQPIALLAGDLNATGPFPFGGRLNLGMEVGGVLVGVDLVADGNRAVFPDFFFRTDANGDAAFAFPRGGLTPGLTVAFQAIVFTGDTSVIAFSNAVELAVQ